MTDPVVGEEDGSIWTGYFWKKTAERAIKSVAGGIAVVLTASGANTDLAAMGKGAAVASGISVCLSVASNPFGKAKGTPSLV